MQDIPIISVGGGKGGTGKTFVSTNISLALANKGYKVLLVDADVDAPNVHVLLNTERNRIETVTSFIPEIDFDKCIQCGKCVEACRPHSLLAVMNDKSIFFEDLCKGCRACQIVCPEDAIKDGKKEVGWINDGESGGVQLLMGELKLGEAKATEVVVRLREMIKEKIENNTNLDIVIIDVSPGAHCDVLRSIRDVSLSIGVTEPTPFGAHDVKRFIHLAKIAKVPVRLVLNRVGMAPSEEEIEEVARNENVPLMGKIPYDPAALESYAMGKPIVKSNPDAPSARALETIAKNIEEEFLK